jgi:hypothetical protein
VKNSLQGSAGPRVIQFSVSAANPEGNSDNTIQYCKYLKDDITEIVSK